MSNVMSLKLLKNNVKRNGFDLSFKNAFTAKIGELLPVMCKEVIPGDKFKINAQCFTRTRPLESAAFVRMREYYDVFFVPYKLLWNRYYQFFTNLPDFHHAASINSSGVTGDVHPYFTLYDIRDYIEKLLADTAHLQNYQGYNRDECTTKLLSYLGYSDLTKSLSFPIDASLNPNPLLAYQKICQDFFRDDQWESAAPWRYNLDYMMSASDPHIPVSDIDLSNYTMFDLNYCNWPKDYFMGMLPSKQYGEEVYVPLANGSINGDGFSLGADGAILQFVGSKNEARTSISGSASFFQRDSSSSDGWSSLDGANNDGSSVGSISGPSFSLNVPPGGSTSLGISILALRQAEAMQKWREIAQSGRQDYKTQMEKHFGVSPSEAASDHCRYLGGWTSNLDINDVTNTNLSATGASADLFGKGTFAARGGCDFEAKEHGIIMCIYHCMPLLDYSINGFTKLNLKTSFTDYAIPEFDSVGMQELRQCELAFASDIAAGSFTKVLGYVPRYAEYKTSYDQIHGAFVSTLPQWVAPLTTDMLNAVLSKTLNYTFFKVNPNIVDNLFGVSADSSVDTDQLLINAFFDIKAVRNLDYNGLPY